MGNINFPKILDDANVLYIGVSSNNTFGLTKNADTTLEMQIKHLAIAKYPNDKIYYIFACNDKWEVIGDLAYESEEEAMQDALRYYKQKTIKWIKTI